MADREVIEQIRDAIDLRDLISETCELDSTGRGVHGDRHGKASNPCLSVHHDYWSCFHIDCNEGGDVFAWIMGRDGVDFPEALRTAAEIAGIELDGTDPEAEIERRAVYDVLKAAAVHFHENLADTHRADIVARWGITDETIDRLLIGISRTDDGLEIYLRQRGYTHDQMVKSGLFFNWENRLKPHFNGRLVFPYWKSGTIRYMIARQTDRTPKTKYERAKYKKLLTSNEKRPYVSQHIKNDILYGMDSLRGASGWCLITEGVTDCIMGLQAGMPCISPVTTKFRKQDHARILKLVRRFDTVYVCNDSEDTEAGKKGAIGMAEYLEANEITTRLVILPRPVGVEKVDLAEYLRAHDVDEFMALFDVAASVWTVKLSMQPVSGDAVESVKTAKRFITEELSQMDAAERAAFIASDVRVYFGLSDTSVRELVRAAPANMDAEKAALIVELAEGMATFFHTPEDQEFAMVDLQTGGVAVRPINSKKFKQELSRRYFEVTGKPPSREHMTSAIDVLCAFANFRGEEIELHNRVAWHEGNIYYDLTNDRWEVVEITPDGWKVINNPPVKFRRYGHQRAQVMPDPDGDIREFLQFTNVGEAGEVLALVHLCTCAIPDIPHTILNAIGDHGSAKTMFGQLEKRVIDPSVLGVLSLPNKKNELIQQLSHHWLPIYDNLQKIQGWQSDCFCRACTGEGDSKRELYTDDDDVFFHYRRCIILNGINNVATQPDLSDRLFFLRFERIPEDKRRTEEEIFREFEASKARILGGIFSALSKALAIKPSIKLKRLPRMADWTLWGCAVAEAMGYGKAAFLDAYYSNIEEMNLEALRESIIGECILELMKGKARWTGMPTEFYNAIDQIADGLKIDKKSGGYPKAANALTGMLNTIVPNLADEGIKVIRDRNKKKRKITIINERLDGDFFSLQHNRRRPSSSSPGENSNENTQYETVRKGDDVENKDRHRPSPGQKTVTLSDAKDEYGDGDTVTRSRPSPRPSPQKQERVVQGDGGDGGDGTLLSSICENVCGKCGCELSGQTFQGPAGLGMICEDCQAEIDRQKFAGGDLEPASTHGSFSAVLKNNDETIIPR